MSTAAITRRHRQNRFLAPLGLQNKAMNAEVYGKRRAVIALIHEAKALVPNLPRIEVRITGDHETILGCAEPGANAIWITEGYVASRHVVFHEILHAVYAQPHVPGCPLMGPTRKGAPSDAELNRLFCHYAK